MKSSSLLALAVAAAALTAGAVSAAPVKFDIDPNHTYPSFNDLARENGIVVAGG